mgnify:CR=1 FL=1
MVSGRPTEYGIMIRGEKIFMGKALCFDPDGYVVKCCALEGVTVQYRAYEGLEYCAAPADPIQKLNLYVPEDYYAGAHHNGYTLHTAPIFLPNTVGGYLPGPADCPGRIASGTRTRPSVRWHMAMLWPASACGDAPPATGTRNFLKDQKQRNPKQKPAAAWARLRRLWWT